LPSRSLIIPVDVSTLSPLAIVVDTSRIAAMRGLGEAEVFALGTSMVDFASVVPAAHELMREREDTI